MRRDFRSRGLAKPALLLLATLWASGCKQEEGDRCQLDSDCSGELRCCYASGASDNASQQEKIAGGTCEPIGLCIVAGDAGTDGTTTDGSAGDGTSPDAAGSDGGAGSDAGPDTAAVTPDTTPPTPDTSAPFDTLPPDQSVLPPDSFQPPGLDL